VSEVSRGTLTGRGRVCRWALCKNRTMTETLVAPWPSSFASPRLRMRPIDEDDVPAISRLWTDPEVRRFLGGPIPEDRVHLREQWCVGAFCVFCVERIEDSSVVGMLTVEPGARDGRTELSYDFLPDFWGHGYAREAVASALEWIRTNVAADTLDVIAVTQEANTPSRRLLEALGARQTGSMIGFGAPQAVYTFAPIA
jgi:RimJ/RimL family protein N-acetyltransferase